ncbi:MAG: hypothetical protein ACFFDN_31820 [Candidatus Hodarchaeota archaeon]
MEFWQTAAKPNHGSEKWGRGELSVRNYFIEGIPKSLQIFIMRTSLISVCLGIKDLLFNLDSTTKNDFLLL